MLLQRFVRRRAAPSTFAASEQQQRCLRSFSSSLPCLQLVRARTLLGSCEGARSIMHALDRPSLLVASGSNGRLTHLARPRNQLEPGGHGGVAAPGRGNWQSALRSVAAAQQFKKWPRSRPL